MIKETEEKMSEEEIEENLEKIDKWLKKNYSITDEELVDSELIDSELIEKDLEIERLNNIIKEAREYIEELAEDDGDFIGEIDRRRKVELLEILDKVEENK